MMLFSSIFYKIKFYGFNQYIISKLLEYNIFLFAYGLLYLFVKLQLVLTMVRTRFWWPIVKLIIKLIRNSVMASTASSGLTYNITYI